MANPGPVLAATDATTPDATSIDTTTSDEMSTEATSSGPPRRRDAAATRRLLLEAGLHRFSTDGYDATTVRQIADDAGVNVALINRYFTSKVGLFEACITTAVKTLTDATADLAPLEADADTTTRLARVAESVSRQTTLTPRGTGAPPTLLLLLRSSGDAAAENLRLGMLRTFGERLAEVVGWSPEHPRHDELLLRAQLVVATSVGMTILRTTGPSLSPLATASAEELLGPLEDLVHALLGERVPD